MGTERRVVVGCVAGLGLVVAGLMGGCSRADQYRMDPSPRIDTRSQTPDEIANDLTIVNDANFRMMWNDMGRLFLMDKRSMLDPGPKF